MSDNLSENLALRQSENFGGGGGAGSSDSHSQVRHRDCRKPKNDPL